MNLILLTPFDLGLAAGLILALAALSWRMELGIAGQLLVAALRTAVQLMLIGFVLKVLFENVNVLFMVVVASVMALAAGREVMARQQYRFAGLWGFGLGTLSMTISSFAVTLLALTIIIEIEPWYAPQYAIPLLGMVLGNSMTAIALAVDRLTATVRQQRNVVEARLALGEGWASAIGDLRRDSVRTGLVPIINAMAAAGIVSLPGMMTGQILAGAPPIEAVKYQILIMFLIAVSSGLGTVVAVWLGSRHLFDARQRLRLERLRGR